MSEDKRQTEVRKISQKKSDVKSFVLCGVGTVTFRVLPWFIDTKCFSCSKTMLQLIVVPPGEYPINRSI
jgi:hypothetical protein